MSLLSDFFIISDTDLSSYDRLYRASSFSISSNETSFVSGTFKKDSTKTALSA